jgi:SAM-dependent methyltransferase
MLEGADAACAPTVRSALRPWRSELPGQFDVVTCMEMLEHVPDPESVVRACATLVKPGGWVFFSTHQPQSQIVSVCDCGCGIRAEFVAARYP